MRRLLTAGYGLSLCWLVLTGIGFARLTPGFAARSGDGPFFCHELLSSGRDDDVMVASFTLFAIPLGARLLRWTRPVIWFELLLFWSCTALVLLALWLASLDCAEIFYSAFAVPDPLLGPALGTLPLAAVLLHRLR